MPRLYFFRCHAGNMWMTVPSDVEYDLLDDLSWATHGQHTVMICVLRKESNAFWRFLSLFIRAILRAWVTSADNSTTNVVESSPGDPNPKWTASSGQACADFNSVPASHGTSTRSTTPEKVGQSTLVLRQVSLHRGQLNRRTVASNLKLKSQVVQVVRLCS